MNCFLGHLHDGDIATVEDTVRYCTFFSCQCNGCSIVVGIRNMWLDKVKYGVAFEPNKCFTERLDELDELLYKVTQRSDWSRGSKTWHCGNCVANRYQYDVGSRQYLKLHRPKLDTSIIHYSKEALERNSPNRPVSFKYKDQLYEYNKMKLAINGCPKFCDNRLSSFQTCLLFQTLAITGILPLQCYEYSEVDERKGPYSLIRNVYNSQILSNIKETKARLKVRTNKNEDAEDVPYSPVTVITEVNRQFIQIKLALSGKGKSRMAIPGISHEYLENVLCKISGYLKTTLEPSAAEKGHSASDYAKRSSIIRELLFEENHVRLHRIIKTNTDVTTCAKWDYHFYDNGMKKISNLYRVRPTTKQSGPVLEVRCSNSSASLPFRVVYNCDDLKVDDSGLQSVYILLYGSSVL